jgi:hypothetical protein
VGEKLELAIIYIKLIPAPFHEKGALFELTSPTSPPETITLA